MNDTEITAADEIDNTPSLDDGKIYHLFLSHSSEDLENVREILEILEKAPYNLKCCIDRRDFMYGLTTSKNIEDAAFNSMATVFFLSPRFLKSAYCNHELDVAYSMYMERKTRLIPVVLKPCEVPNQLRILNYIDKVTPDAIAQEIMKCFDSDAHERRQYPGTVTAGLTKMNGSKFTFFTSSELGDGSDEVVLFSHQKSDCEQAGIDLSGDKEEGMRLIFEMLQSVPLNCLFSRCATTTYWILSPLIMTTFVSVGCLLAYFITKWKEYDNNPSAYNDNHHTIFNTDNVTSGLGGLYAFLGSFFGWIFCMVCMLCICRKMHTIPYVYMYILNSATIEDYKCMFYRSRVSDEVICIKYDMDECKEYIQNIWKTEKSTTQNFEEYWKYILLSRLIVAYTHDLANTNLQPIKKPRHLVRNSQKCFCQYFESNKGFEVLQKEVCKIPGKSQVSVADTDECTQGLLDHDQQAETEIC